MENRIYQTEEHNVGDDPLASLRPPVGWNPDSDQAWKRLVERGEAGSSTSKARLTVIGIALIAAGSILFFLPWHRVWSPDSKRAEPVVTESQTGPVYTEGVVPTPVVKIQVIPDSQPLSPALPGGQSKPVTAEKNLEQVPQTNDQITPSREAARMEPPGHVGGLLVQTGPEEPRPQSQFTEPILLSVVQPEYTEEARKARIQGMVEVLCIVRVDGTVQVDSIRKGLGYGLDEKAREAVERWKYIPAKRDGVPVSTYVTVHMSFSLR